MKIFLSLLFCIIFATGCSEPQKVENYDNLRDQLVFDVFTQLKSNNHQAALEAFDKLSRKFPDNQFSTIFVAKERKNLSIKKARESLSRNMLSETLTYLEKAEQEGRAKAVREFIHIRNYLSKRPFQTSASAFEYHDQLIRFTPLALENGTFKAFLKKEKAIAKELKEKEYQALLLKMVQTYDKLLLSNNNFSYMLALKYRRILPKQPRYITTIQEAIKALQRKYTEFNIITEQSFVEKLKHHELQSPSKLDEVVSLFYKRKHQQGFDTMARLEMTYLFSPTLKRATFHQSPILAALIKKIDDAELNSSSVSAAFEKKLAADRLKAELERKRIILEAKLKKEAKAKLANKKKAEEDAVRKTQEEATKRAEEKKMNEDLFRIPGLE